MAFVNYWEIGSMLTVAKAIVSGALWRKRSRGAHTRDDYAKRDDENYRSFHPKYAKMANSKCLHVL